MTSRRPLDAPRTLEIEIGGSLGHIGFKLIDELAALPDRNRSTRRTFTAYSSRPIMPAHTPGPRPTW